MDEIYGMSCQRLEKFGYKRDALYRKRRTTKEYDFILVKITNIKV